LRAATNVDLRTATNDRNPEDCDYGHTPLLKDRDYSRSYFIN